MPDPASNAANPKPERACYRNRSVPEGRPLLRSYEWIIIGYFSYTSVLAWWLPLKWPIAAVTVGINVLVVGGLLLLAWAESLRQRKFLGVIRDWYAPPLLLLAYREMGWFAMPHPGTALEQAWVVWDRILLYELGLKALIESLGPVLPAILEIAYIFVYPMAVLAVVVLYVYRRRAVVAPFLFNFVLAVLSVYALFPYFPSEPPWTVFPGEDFPAHETVFRRLNGRMLGELGIHTSVFPSGHVAGAISAACALVRLLPERKWVGRAAVALAVCITLATVYCRYHYVVDALAGLAMALAASGASVWIEKRQAGRRAV